MKKLRILHKVAAILALLMISGFFISSLIAETWGDRGDIMQVKQGIVHALFLLAPLMAVTALSGRKLGLEFGHHDYAQQKQKRMRLIGINALFFLIPLALMLHYLAQQGEFGTLFIALQVLEFMAGGVNIYLMASSIRQGMVLKRYRELNV